MTSSSEQAKSRMASFALVRFCHVPESYVAGCDVECAYVISEQLEISSRDWVGLYKVGWRLPSDYIYYDWSPLPSNYVSGTEVTNRVTFPASKLPKDDGEFYQFCYVTGSGMVRGASPPFQFKHPMTDDFIEIEDENGELLVIRSKTAVLEEQLKKANDHRAELKQKISLLENEKALASFEIQVLEKKLVDQKNDFEMLQGQLRESAEKNADLQQEAKDLHVCVRSLQEKIEVLNQEKLTMEKRLDDSDVYIVSLQEKIKNLVTEKDSLLGLKKTLEEEKEQYQCRAESSEKQHQLMVEECEQLAGQLAVAEANKQSVCEEINILKNRLEQHRQEANKQTFISSETKENMAFLKEVLQNAEDKLEAAELCKQVLNEEVLALKQAFEKISKDLEVAKAESDSLRRHARRLESKTAHDMSLKEKELEELTVVLKQKETEVKKLSDQLVELRESCKSGNSNEDAMLVLQSTQATLTERYTKLLRRNEELVQSLRRMEEKEADQKQLIDTLKDRLRMGGEAYKDVAFEQQRLKTELNRLSAGTSGSERRFHAARHNLTGAESDITSHELNQHMSEIRAEMEKRTSKLAKYKRLYIEEKRKRENEVHQLKQLLEDKNQSQPSSESVTQLKQEQKQPAAFVDSETLQSFDPLSNTDSCHVLTTPLKPLPPPMQPEILPSAKVAIVKASLTLASQPSDIVVIKKPGGEQSVFDMSADLDQASQAEEDKFVDAPGEPLETSGNHLDDVDSPDNTLLSNAEHEGAVNDQTPSHDFREGFVCPMCEEAFPSDAYGPFERHVNQHFD